MKHINSGKCDCDKVALTVELPDELEKYSPRKCDCDFCVERNASYLSDPRGTLHIISPQPFKVIKHGSKQAMFLCCAACGTLISVVYQFSDGLKGAVNAALLQESEHLQKPIIVSPKFMEPQEKLRRWESVWLCIRINGNSYL